MAVEKFFKEIWGPVCGVGEGRIAPENWRGLEPGDDGLTTCKMINTHASQRYLQAANNITVNYFAGRLKNIHVWTVSQ